MRSYRLLLLDKSGHLVGNKSINCGEDREAIAYSALELQGCEYVEVWNGGRPVCICAKPQSD
jgi:hypothetical protein